MSNRLAQESSPYLLQHQNNPVDWYPWGPEALARAKAEDKPIFLSIGYSACHWCHVMEHESFENEKIAAELNRNFVCIKVDREERPDLDQIYMNAVQLMTGRGGWPMSVFLTPDLQPFFGGTYWPPTSRMGMPGFDLVIQKVSEAWRGNRQIATEQAAELTQAVQSLGVPDDSPGVLRRDMLDHAESRLERAFDFQHGGFGSAPKFPHSMDLQVLLRQWKHRPREAVRQMVTLTLDKMAGGGIYDHLGGGFARYSVDERWLVPHFEKMLYDNALLTNAYLEGFLATSEPRFARTVRDTCDYILAYMTDDSGGFHSTEDADSEGEEGKFYVWTPEQIHAALGRERGERFCYVYDVTEAGNFEEGKSILNLPKTLAQCASLRGWDVSELERELAQSRAELLKVRDQRVRPGKDDKILVSWNALMIDALARSGAALDEPRYLAAAGNAADFLLAKLRRPDGRLLHSWRHGHAKLDAYLDDYAYLVNALVSLYEATFEERWIDRAVELADGMLAHFADKQGSGFFFTADDHEQLIARNKDLHDSSVPSGNAMAATGLVRLGKLTGRQDYLEAARGTLQMMAALLEKTPNAAAQALIALDLLLGPTPEIVIVGDLQQPATKDALQSLRQRFLPNQVVACRPVNGSGARSSHLDPLFEGRTGGSGGPTVYICQDFACQAPVAGDAIEATWQKLAS